MRALNLLMPNDMAHQSNQKLPPPESTKNIEGSSQFYEHVDGGLYQLATLGKSSEDGSPVAIYEHLHPFERGMWSRPWPEFSRRFLPIGPERAGELLARNQEQARAEVSDRKARRKSREAAELCADPKHSTHPEAKLYSLGLMFSLDGSRVALIRKKTPLWQAGKLNGIGGKAEPGETSLEAMTREFFEEAGVETSPDSWSFFARIGAPEFEVHAFCCFTDDINSCQSMTAEDIVIMSPRSEAMELEGLPGLAVLARAALDHRAQGVFARFDYRQWAHEAASGLLERRQPPA